MIIAKTHILRSIVASALFLYAQQSFSQDITAKEALKLANPNVQVDEKKVDSLESAQVQLAPQLKAAQTNNSPAANSQAETAQSLLLAQGIVITTPPQPRLNPQRRHACLAPAGPGMDGAGEK